MCYPPVMDNASLEQRLISACCVYVALAGTDFDLIQIAVLGPGSTIELNELSKWTPKGTDQRAEVKPGSQTGVDPCAMADCNCITLTLF